MSRQPAAGQVRRRPSSTVALAPRAIPAFVGPRSSAPDGSPSLDAALLLLSFSAAGSRPQEHDAIPAHPSAEPVGGPVLYRRDSANNRAAVAGAQVTPR